MKSNEVTRILGALNHSINRRDAAKIHGLSRAAFLVCHEAALQGNGQWSAGAALWAKQVFENALTALDELESEISRTRSRVLDRYRRLLPYIQDAVTDKMR